MDDFKRSRKLSSSLGLFDGRESMYNTATSTRALRGKLSARLALFAVLAFLIAEGFTGHFFPIEDFVNGVEDFPGLNSFPQPQSPPPSSMSMGWRQRGRRVEKAGPTKLISATVKELETHQETVIYLPGLAQPCWDQPVSSQLGARFPTVRWVSLEAPARTVSVHNASELAWFDLKAFPVTAGDENTAQIYESARLIQSAIVAERSELIRTLRKRGGLEALPRGQRVRILRGSNTVEVGDGHIGTKAEREWASSRIVLAGFSQGAVMALYTALTLEDRLAGVVVLSGFLPLRSQIASLVADADRSNLPLFWGHGIEDPFLLFADAVSSVAQLQATTTSAGKRIGLGLTDVEFHSYPNVEHTWFPLEYIHVGDFLERIFQSHRPSKKAQSPQPQQ